MIDNSFIFDEFKKIKDKIITSSNYSIKPLSPFNAQIPLGLTSKAWENQPYEAGCAAHKLQFRTKKTISSYCFDCYKIEIQPRTVLELFKLLFIFDRLRLIKNNHRKLWLRPRKELTVNYSGTLYFRSLVEANAYFIELRNLIDRSLSKDIFMKIKRGCSEFNSLIPEYHNIDYNYDSLVKNKAKWKNIEINFIKEYNKKPLPKLPLDVCQSIKDFTFQHYNILFTWLAFAKVIGDDSYKVVMGNDDSELISQSLMADFITYFNKN